MKEWLWKWQKAEGGRTWRRVFVSLKSLKEMICKRIRLRLQMRS